MTQASFARRLRFVIAGAITILVVCAIAKVMDQKAVYEFFKDLSSYVLLAIGPYVAFIFAARAKFVESLQAEWRKINSVKQNIIGYVRANKRDEDKFDAIYNQLSVAIDDMRIIYCNVGESDRYVGHYPYQTLHDFRRCLEKVDPRKPDTVNADRREIQRHVVDSFQAFREIFLLELPSTQPEFPIVEGSLKRKKIFGVDPKQKADVERKLKLVRDRFGHFSDGGEAVQ